MFSLDKRLRTPTADASVFHSPRQQAGWEVREERDSEVVRRMQFQDWHRVERARRSIAIELDALQRKGWSEVPVRLRTS